MTSGLENPFLYINPYKNTKGALSEKMEIDSVYLYISHLKISSSRKRPLYNIINQKNNKSVIRKLRGKNSIKKNEITFDRMTYNELDLKEDMGTILLAPIKWHRKYTAYFWFHPKEDIRIGYKFFLLGLAIGLISIILGILSLFE